MTNRLKQTNTLTRHIRNHTLTDAYVFNTSMPDETGGTDASWVTDVTPGEMARPRAARLLAEPKGGPLP